MLKAKKKLKYKNSYNDNEVAVKIQNTICEKILVAWKMMSLITKKIFLLILLILLILEQRGIFFRLQNTSDCDIASTPLYWNPHTFSNVLRTVEFEISLNKQLSLIIHINFLGTCKHSVFDGTWCGLKEACAKKRVKDPKLNPGAHHRRKEHFHNYGDHPLPAPFKQESVVHSIKGWVSLRDPAALKHLHHTH